MTTTDMTDSSSLVLVLVHKCGVSQSFNLVQLRVLDVTRTCRKLWMHAPQNQSYSNPDLFDHHFDRALCWLAAWTRLDRAACGRPDDALSKICYSMPNKELNTSNHRPQKD
jgi:hypothetical protein